MRMLLLALASFLFAWPSAAQEFACVVDVDYRNLPGTEFRFLDELESRLDDYVNRQVWTDDRYREAERIDCNITVVVSESVSLTSFRGTLIVSSRRPVYGTVQQQPLVLLQDDQFEFQYSQGTSLQQNFERYDPLTSVIDFYLFVLLGYDYDSFSEMGGAPYFEQARQIADRAQSAGGAGWVSLGGDQTRGNLIQQLVDPRFVPLRKGTFTYHFDGLDRFLASPDEARASILSVLRDYSELYDEVSRSYVLDTFFNSKYAELVAIFQDSPYGDEAYALLAEVDPAHLSQYSALTE